MQKTSHADILSDFPKTELEKSEKAFRIEIADFAIQEFGMTKKQLLLAHYRPDLDFDEFLSFEDVVIASSKQLENTLINLLREKILEGPNSIFSNKLKRRIIESDLEL